MTWPRKSSEGDMPMDSSVIDAHEQVTPQARVKAVLNELRPSERRVAEVIIDSPELIVESSAEQLAAATGIARTSVIRAAQRLGYPGYSQLRIAVSRQLVVDRAPVAAAPGMLGALRADIELLASRLPESLGLLREEDIERAVELLAGSPRTLCLANGLSGPLAADLAMRLASLGLRAEYLADAIGQQVNARHLAEGDVLMVLSGSGANELTLRSVRAARATGAKIIAVTSFGSSPLTELADFSLVIASVQGTFRDELEHTSRIGHAVFLDALVLRVGERLGVLGRGSRDRSLEVIADNLIDAAG